MGIFDKLKGKARQATEENPDKVSEGLDKAGSVADEKTGGRHTEQVDAGVDKARGVLGVDSAGVDQGDQASQGGDRPGGDGPRDEGDQAGQGGDGPGDDNPRQGDG